MNILKGDKCWKDRLMSNHLRVIARFFVLGVVLSIAMIACKSDDHPSPWHDETTLTISQYITNHQAEYSKSYRLLVEAKLLTTLYAYNPYGSDYTLFLPTDEAIDRLIEQNEKYGDFEELVKDSSYIKTLMRYHIINRSYHTDQFPDGAFVDTTLTGKRLVASFFAVDNNQLIKINNRVPIIKRNLKMTNGYIHVVSDVIQPATISGYDWLQQQEEYTILAQAMERVGLRLSLWWNQYTLLAEPDSVYHLYGINNVEDLISQLATPGMALNDIENPFCLFTLYHIINGKYYMNDWVWGSKKYPTYNTKFITIDAGHDIKFNTEVDTYVVSVSATGETTSIDYIRVLPEKYNILTSTGPVHSIADLLYNDKLPKGLKDRRIEGMKN